MTDSEELAYLRGERVAWLGILHECLRRLHYTDAPEAIAARLVVEREEAIAKLRDLCEGYGDNDWPDELHLADIIEKHIDWD